jgi:hypothetical protein
MSIDDVKWLIGEIIVPIVTFIGGSFLGYGVCKHKYKSTVKGNNNTTVQGSPNTNIKKD